MKETETLAVAIPTGKNGGNDGEEKAVCGVEVQGGGKRGGNGNGDAGRDGRRQTWRRGQ